MDLQGLILFPHKPRGTLCRFGPFVLLDPSLLRRLCSTPSETPIFEATISHDGFWADPDAQSSMF